MCWILDDLFKSVFSLSLTYLTYQVFNYGYIFFISKSVVWFFFKLPWSFGVVPLFPLFLFFEHIKCTYFAFCIWWFLYFSPFLWIWIYSLLFVVLSETSLWWLVFWCDQWIFIVSLHSSELSFREFLVCFMFFGFWVFFLAPPFCFLWPSNPGPLQSQFSPWVSLHSYPVTQCVCAHRHLLTGSVNFFLKCMPVSGCDKTFLEIFFILHSSTWNKEEKL